MKPDHLAFRAATHVGGPGSPLTGGRARSLGKPSFRGRASSGAARTFLLHPLLNTVLTTCGATRTGNPLTSTNAVLGRTCLSYIIYTGCCTLWYLLSTQPVALWSRKRLLTSTNAEVASQYESTLGVAPSV